MINLQLIYNIKCNNKLYKCMYIIQGCKSVSSIGGMISIFWWFFWYWGDDLRISSLGGLFWILACPNSCFSTHFFPIFLMTFFLLATFFSPFLVKIALTANKFSPSCTLRPLKYFHCAMMENIKTHWAKIEIIGGMEVKYWGGGMYPPTPPEFAALILCNV